MRFTLVIHSHHPVGMTDEQLREHYEKAWLPILMLFRERTSVKCCLYHSGVAWDHIVQSGSDYVATLRSLLQDSRVELLGGGRYEPLLPLLTEEDALAQVGAMQRVLEDTFDVLPRGLWLDGALWEASLPSMLIKSDIDYLVTDSTLTAKQLDGPFVVEDRGACLRLFPYQNAAGSSKAAIVDLCTRQHEAAPESTVMIGLESGDFLAAADEGKLVLNVDAVSAVLDGLAELDEDTFSAVLPAELVDAGQATRRVWPQWDSPVGLRQNLVSRPSVDGLYRKMLHVSKKIQFSGRATREIRESLLKGQCATSLLHANKADGLTRMANWRELLTAEDLVDGRLHGKGSWVDVDEIDYDGDGAAELLVGSRQLNAYFTAARGGSCFELDYKPRRVNVFDSVAPVSSCFTHGFVDLVLPRIPEAGTVQQLTVDDSQWQSAGPCETRVVSDRDTRVIFTRTGTVEEQGAQKKVSLEKTFRFAADQSDFKVRYRLINRGPGPLELPFAVAFGFRAPAGSELASALFVDNRELEGSSPWPFCKEMAQDVVLEDRPGGYRMRLQFTMCSQLFLVPIEWANESTGGLGVLTVWEGPLPEGEILELDMAVEFEALEYTDA